MIETHRDVCKANYDDENGILFCYSCGEAGKEYSQSQFLRQEKARCKDCVEGNKTKRFAKFSHLFKLCHGCSQAKHIDDELYQAIMNLKLEKVQELLERGANSNYVRQDTFRLGHLYVYWYRADGSEKEEIDDFQPTTPLKLCIFRYSDCTLSDENRASIVEIAKLLITFGASVSGASSYYESRYGELRSDCVFYNVLVDI